MNKDGRGQEAGGGGVVSLSSLLLLNVSEHTFAQKSRVTTSWAPILVQCERNSGQQSPLVVERAREGRGA